MSQTYYKIIDVTKMYEIRVKNHIIQIGNHFDDQILEHYKGIIARTKSLLELTNDTQ